MRSGDGPNTLAFDAVNFGEWSGEEVVKGVVFQAFNLEEERRVIEYAGGSGEVKQMVMKVACPSVLGLAGKMETVLGRIFVPEVRRLFLLTLRKWWRLAGKFADVHRAMAILLSGVRAAIAVRQHRMEIATRTSSTSSATRTSPRPARRPPSRATRPHVSHLRSRLSTTRMFRTGLSMTFRFLPSMSTQRTR